MLTPEEQKQFLRDAAAIAGVPLKAGPIILPEEGDVVVGPRMRLHYHDWGAPFTNAPDILFLHGGGLTAHTWDLVCMQLRDQYRCLAPDLRGHGDSEWSPELDYHPSTMARDTEGFVAAMGLQKFILVGMSMGGLTSLHYAGRHAANLRALVIVDVGPDLNTEGGRRIQDFIKEGETIGGIEELVERAMRFNPLRSPELLRRSLLLNLRERPDGEWIWKYDRRRYTLREEEQQRGIDRMAEDSKALWNVIPRISCPALIVRGGESDVFTDANAKKLVGALPEAELVVVPGAGHTVQGDQPVALAEALADFLSRRVAAPGTPR